MISRRSLLGGVAGIAMAVMLPVGAVAGERVAAVATFSILGDMVATIGGDRVTVTSLVGPDGDSHVYQPTPSDARNVASADIVFANGLGLEGWMDRLVDASGFSGPVVVATDGIVPLKVDDAAPADEHDHDHEHEHEHEAAHDADHDSDHDHEAKAAAGGDHAHHHGDIDPHAWQSLANARIYVANIAAALTRTDPAGAEVYAANLARYLSEIAAVEEQVKALVAALPPHRRTVVTSHDAFAYFERDYGIRFLSPQGVTTEAEASAADVATLIRQIRDEEIAAVFAENITDPRLLERISEETGARIGGTLYSGALSGPDGPAATYLDMMRHNIETLSAALTS